MRVCDVTYGVKGSMTNAKAPTIDLKKILSGAQLPALPQSAIRLLELSQDPENGPAEFAVPIESDPGLTGQVLRFVNSSYFGFSREISSVKLAITLVGIRTIKNFALWSAVFSLMPNPKCGPFDLKSLWQDSLRRALFARAMAKLLRIKEVEEPFAAALLQDMAVPLLAKEAPEVYEKLLEARHDGRIRLSYLEDKVFGWTHAEAAGIMARQWNLPDAFALLVENHQAIERWVLQPKEDAGRLAVALSALLPSTADKSWHECSLFEEYYQKVAPPGSPLVIELLGQIDEEFSEFAPVLKLATPAKSLVDRFSEVASATS
ncbi:MAG: HDOD domain-containing protein [Pirellulales bacterium]|nr:HDOD domain-containing protein [Pirellulales bacterium]